MTYDELWRRLAAVYDAGEAKAIVRMVLDERFGLSATDVYCGKVTQLSSDKQTELEKIMQRLELAEPVQYVLGTTMFCDRPIHVAPGVLIPRPETEDLCRWVIERATSDSLLILDVGTGSGCIAITLALDLSGAKVTAWDVSTVAINIAGQNAERLCADVNFMFQDALAPPSDEAKWNVIVSNPPYICEREKKDMERNVLDNEPSLALFVPDSEPLLFYRAIACYACKALKDNGFLFFEINPLYVDDMLLMLEEMGYVDLEVRTDQFGKQRFIKAVKI
ncbi:MAG: peptide chain release factor N(5)-glutamine methyltransferase [Prevotella sp.]|nr:peptide chain release factor N(5)-glutamine methyltransferase [Prevotella sp.]